MTPSMPSRGLLGALPLALLLAACGPKAPDAEPVRAVRTMLLQASEAQSHQTYAAELRARSESRLAFRVGGKVASREVGLGQQVKKGQVLMRLDPQDLRLAADAAQAALRAAKTNRDQQLADLKRFRELRAQGFISGTELERREVAYQAAQSQFEQAQAQARAQLNQAGYGELRADAAGVITSVDAEPGTVVAAGTPVLRLAQSGPLDVVFQVPEQDVARLREQAAGGRLEVTVTGVPGPYRATLREVAQAADPATRTFLVKADIGAQPLVRLGQTATVELLGAVNAGVLKLPMSAIFERQGAPHVWVLDGNAMTLKARPVQLGGADGNSVVVAGGLQPGQEVVTAGTHVLREGQKVKRFTPLSVPAAAKS
jgi:RND family efflux transporter MFP subunit